MYSVCVLCVLCVLCESVCALCVHCVCSVCALCVLCALCACCVLCALCVYSVYSVCALCDLLNLGAVDWAVMPTSVAAASNNAARICTRDVASPRQSRQSTRQACWYVCCVTVRVLCMCTCTCTCMCCARVHAPCGPMHRPKWLIWWYCVLCALCGTVCAVVCAARMLRVWVYSVRVLSVYCASV